MGGPTMPDWAQYVRERLRLPRLQPEREAEIVEELAGQLEQAYSEATQRGMPPAQAEAAAIQHVADWAALASELAQSERGRESAVGVWQRRAEDRELARRGKLSLFTDLRQDVRYAVRVLGKSPGFTAVAVLTLALGIGANSAIFSLVDAILLSRLPVRDPQSLVLLEWSARKEPNVHSSWGYGDCEAQFGGPHPHACSFSKPFLEEVKAQTDTFSGLAMFAYAGELNVSGNGAASLGEAQYVSGGYFATLGVRPAAGRLIQPADDSDAAPAVAVLSYGYWQSAFGGGPGAVGRTIHLQGLPFTIVGVAEAAFPTLAPGHTYDFWIPLSQRRYLQKLWAPATEDEGSWWLVAAARLKPGVSLQAAETAVSRLFFNDVVHGKKPLNKPEDAPAVRLLPLEEGLQGQRGSFRSALSVLMLAVGVVLLIACANVAGLMLARASGRHKEIAVRLALGATRGRILRQLLTESLVMSVAGGVLGTLLAIWSASALLQFLANWGERATTFATHLDLRVLGFTILASVATGVFSGLAPALRSMHVDLAPALKQADKPGGSGRRARWWLDSAGALVVAQVALTVVVLVGAGLLVRTLEGLERVDPGFETANILTFEVDPTLTGFQGEKLGQFFRDLREQFSAMPGVNSASFSVVKLLSGSLWRTSFRPHGDPAEKEVDSDILQVGPQFFSTMHLPLVAGREFTIAEFELKASKSGALCSRASESMTPVAAVVNEAFAHKLFAGQNPVGQRFGGGKDPNAGPDDCPDPGWQITGVVRDARYQNLRREPEPTIYEPSGEGGAFELRTAGDPRAIIASVREVLRRSGFDLPIHAVRTEQQQIDDLLHQERLLAGLSSMFGLLALLLACIGMYGLLAFEVTGRTREIGIRMALGARGASVLRSVVGRGLGLAAAGGALGIAVSLGLTRYLSSMLFAVKPGDPLTLAGVAVLLLLVAFGACYGPARRATRVDPLVALRYE